MNGAAASGDRQFKSFRLRLHSGLRQSGSAFGATFSRARVSSHETMARPSKTQLSPLALPFPRVRSLGAVRAFPLRARSEMASGFRRRQQQARHRANSVARAATLNSPTSRYTLSPAQKRTTLRCLSCEFEPAQPIEGELGFSHQCPKCAAKWYASHCWNCETGFVDSRDPATPLCPSCGWYKCACGACHLRGCTTNPFTHDRRERDLNNANAEGNIMIPLDNLPF